MGKKRGGFLANAVRSLLIDRLTLSGRLVLALAFLAHLMGMGSYAMGNSFVSDGLLGLILVSGLGARWARVRLNVGWEIPGRVTPGVPFSVRFTLENPTGRGARDLSLVVGLPAGATMEPPQGDYVAWLGPGQEAHGQLTLTFPRRGHFVIPTPRQATVFPFGLWTLSTRRPGGHASL